MKALRTVFYALGVVVVLVVAGLIAVAVLFDANALKGEIERTVQAKTGRTLKLEGDLHLAFWPSIGASLGRASLSERDGKSSFLGLESAHVSVAVMPLLSKQLVVSGVRLDGLKATVTRDKAGRYNFDDLLAAPAAAKTDKPGAPAPQAPAEAGAVRFDIGSVRIARSAISYRDAKSGQAIDVSDFNLSTGRIADDTPGDFELSAQVKSNTPPADARVALSGSYRFNLAKKAFALSGLDAKVEGAAAGIRGLLLTLKGDVAADPAAQSYAVNGFSLNAKGSRAQDAFEAKVTAPKLAIAPDKASGAAVDAAFTLKSPQRSADGTLKLSGVEGTAKALKIASLAAQLNLSDPALPMKTLSIPLNGTLQANLEKQTLQADLTSKFDETNLKAKLGLAKFSPPAVTFDIDADRLNLDRYLGKPAAGGGQAGGAPAGTGGGGAADPKVDLSGLKGIDAKGRVHIGALQVQNAKLTDVTANVQLANGRLDVSPHSAKLYQGALSGALSADANGNRVALKQTLSNVSVGPLLRDVAQKDAIEGRGNVALDLRTAGGTVGAMKKALAGTARVHLRDGAVKGIDLAETLRKAKAVLGAKTAREQAAEGDKKTDFSELSGSFNVQNGVARNNDLQGKAPLFRLAGAGDIDIGNSQINYLAKPTIVATSKGQGGRELAELNGVTVPVRLVGPFDAVKYQVDYGAVATALAKSKITEQITGKTGGGGSGSPLDKLKGLFGK